jgi:hypothetical protein
MAKEVNNEINSEIERFESITKAYESGKRAGIIEGYLRASKNISAVIPLLQDKFIDKINGMSELNLIE